MRLYRDRIDAGRKLGNALRRFRGCRPLVLGLSRGGVPVAAEVAAALEGDLDVIVAKKLGSPVSPELAVGAVTADGTRYLNDAVVSELRVPPAYLEAITAEKRAEAQVQEQMYRAGKPSVPVEGRTVILVDDGLATGSTLIARKSWSLRCRLGLAIRAPPCGAKSTKCSAWPSRCSSWPLDSTTRISLRPRMKKSSTSVVCGVVP